jgi:hypothetical protein
VRRTYVVLTCDTCGEYDFEANWHVAYAGPSIDDAEHVAKEPARKPYERMVVIETWSDGRCAERVTVMVNNEWHGL